MNLNIYCNIIPIYHFSIVLVDVRRVSENMVSSRFGPGRLPWPVFVFLLAAAVVFLLAPQYASCLNAVSVAVSTDRQTDTTQTAARSRDSSDVIFFLRLVSFSGSVS